MNAIPRTFRTAAMSLALTAALAAQSGTTAGSGGHGATSLDASQQQSQGNKMGNTNSSNAQRSNPGFSEQVPNDHTLSGGQPHDNSTYQKDRNGNQGFDLGWLGLLGLAGLFGIGRGRRSDNLVHHHSNDMHDSGSNRS